jgi:cytochrome P450
MWGICGVGVEYAMQETKVLRQVIERTLEFKRETLRERKEQIAAYDEVSLGTGNKDDEKDEKDVLDRLLEAEGWKDEDIVDEVIALFLAGGETSANSIIFALYLLSEHPDMLHRLREELDDIFGPYTAPTKSPNLSNSGLQVHLTWDDLPKLKYLEQIIKETLRLHPVIISSGTRQVTHPDGVELGGYFIPPNSAITIDIRVNHRSEEYWGPTALEFDADRWKEGFTPTLGTYLPFLEGAHRCLGHKMAMVELKCVLARVCYENDVKVVQGQQLNLVTSVTHGYKEGIMMKVRRRRAGVSVW